MSTTLHPLGTMGWIPSQGLQTTCFAFFWGDELIVIDAGSGLSRLLELKETLFKPAWQKLRRVRIFLTHYHLDHIAGLFWIKAIFGAVPLTIYGPGVDIYGSHAVEILDNLFRKPYSPTTLRNFGPSISIEDLNLNGVMIPDGPADLRVSIRHNRNHSDPSVALRFGDLFAIVTDTPPEDEVIGFVRGVQVLFHESYFDSFPAFESESDSLEIHSKGAHTGSFGAGLIALRAGISRLYLMHHNPERPFQQAQEDAAKVSSKLGLDCRAAKDLEPIEMI